MIDALDFESKRDTGSDSWERADPNAALIEQVAWNRWRVTLPDGDHAHEVRIEKQHGAITGDCKALTDGDREPCPARKYNDPDEPCAHLCTIRKAAFGDVEDDAGHTVSILRTEDVQTASSDHAVEEIMADGGRRYRNGGGRR